MRVGRLTGPGSEISGARVLGSNFRSERAQYSARVHELGPSWGFRLRRTLALGKINDFRKTESPANENGHRK